MDDLEWITCDELLDDLLKNPKVQLPQLIKLSEKVTSIDTKECLDEGQILVIHDKRTIAKLEGTDEKGKPIRLPVDCPYYVTLQLPPGKERNFETIETLAKTDPLPKFVEVTEVEGLESVSVGDRLKVVIAEKTGGKPSYIHFRNSTGKHVKIAVDQNISFKLAVNDASEQLLSKVAEKSRELPVAAQFVTDSSPKSHVDLGQFTIRKGFTENVVLASALKSGKQYATVFPLNSNIKFQVNSKLKLTKDTEYRELCSNISKIDVSEVVEYLNVANPSNDKTQYVILYKKLLSIIDANESDHSDNDYEKEELENNNTDENATDEGKEIQLTLHQEQKEIVKKEQKEKERLAKIEKERLKAEKRKEKKERKEREKEEKKKKKSSPQKSSISCEQISEDLYIVPDQSSVPTSPISPVTSNEDQQPQWAMHIMSKVKNVRDRTRSLGLRPKKRNKLKKEDVAFDSTDNLDQPSECLYTGLEGDDEAFSEGLYETLPFEDMCYESLDLIAQARRSLAPKSTDSSGDSGFDEADQAKIKAWRASMQPPPLPGNHPLHNRIDTSNNNGEDLYEVAVDSSAASQSTAWKNFYDIVQHSTNEISTWGMDEVASCLQDLQIGKYKKTFSESQVDGQLLLDLDEAVLKDLGLSLFEARKLRKFVFGWRPDAMRPESYPKLNGFDSNDPSDWDEQDVVAHLRIIDINDVADFCANNQVNGELLKDICVDDSIMNSIIVTRDRKLKTVKIKNYVIDKWRPKKKGEGNYTSYTPVMHKTAKTQSSVSSVSSSYGRSSPVSRSSSSPYTSQRSRKVSDNNTPLGIGKKTVGGDAPLIARMKQQLEDNKNNWQKK